MDSRRVQIPVPLELKRAQSRRNQFSSHKHKVSPSTGPSTGETTELSGDDGSWRRFLSRRGSDTLASGRLPKEARTVSQFHERTLSSKTKEHQASKPRAEFSGTSSLPQQLQEFFVPPARMFPTLSCLKAFESSPPLSAQATHSPIGSQRRRFDPHPLNHNPSLKIRSILGIGMEYPLSPKERKVLGQEEVRSRTATEGPYDCEKSNPPVDDDTLGSIELCYQDSNASPISNDPFATPICSTTRDSNTAEPVTQQLEGDEVPVCISSDSVELLQPTVYPGPSPPLPPLPLAPVAESRPSSSTGSSIFSLSDLVLPSVLPPKDTVFSAKPRDLIISPSSTAVEVPKRWYSARDTPLIALHCRKELECLSEPFAMGIQPPLDKVESSKWSEYSPMSSRSVSPTRGSSVFGGVVEKMKKIVANNNKVKGKTRSSLEPVRRATTFSWPGAGGMGYYAEGEAILQSVSVDNGSGGRGGARGEDFRMERGRGLWRHMGSAEKKREKMREEFKSRIRVVGPGS
ncbi:hypothetical protein BDD12DRAFT_802089 [Trichophaea hybrida]|nr:hypothetical protein BDD12DRAFT_802089 [Trichophaea hybrida]